tara:strand:+ start:232 stop:579 length:348 start_codon:yes stop_codon:yes gene_type:complete
MATINLSWTAPSTGGAVTGYELWRKVTDGNGNADETAPADPTNDADWTAIGAASLGSNASATAFSDDTAEGTNAAPKWNNYVLRAKGAAGNSDWATTTAADEGGVGTVLNIKINS